MPHSFKVNLSPFGPDVFRQKTKRVGRILLVRFQAFSVLDGFGLAKEF